MTFNERTTIGGLDNSSWMQYAIQRTGVRLGNCFTYATARISEIVGYNQSLDGAKLVAGAGQLWGIHDPAFKQSSTPVPGALAIYQGTQWGHVAVVEKVDGDTIWISESNYGDNRDTDLDGLADGFRYLQNTGIVGQPYWGEPGLVLVGFLVHTDLNGPGGFTKLKDERGSMTVTVDWLNVRDMPSTNGKVVATYRKGASFRYDSVYSGDGHIWASYIGRSGKRRYVAAGREEGGVNVEPFGKFN